MQIKPIDQDRLEMITGGRNCCLFYFVFNFACCQPVYYNLKLNTANEDFFFFIYIIYISSTVMYIACKQHSHAIHVD